MPEAGTVALVCSQVRATLADKGAQAGDLASDTRLLGGDLNLDSLDLAAIVVELEQATGHDPFGGGFVDFQTIGELAALFDKT